MDYEKQYTLACHEALKRGRVTCTPFRRGAIITGWPSRWPNKIGPAKNLRGIIRSASVRSLIRGGFAVANSPIDFDAMTVLTFRQAPERAKAALRHFCTASGLFDAPEAAWGWFQEFQERGVVHYHVLHRQQDLAGNSIGAPVEWRPQRRKGVDREVLSGPLEKFVCETWLAATGDRSREARRFNMGGITERVDKPEAIGYYLGRYMSKMGQKQLPENVAPQGRWWWLSPTARPIPGTPFVLTSYPFDRPHHMVFDREKLFSDQMGAIEVGTVALD